MMDFEAKAREIADSLDGNSDGDWPAHIAAALKAAYNQGLESAAYDCEHKFKVHWHGHKVALYGIAEAVRSKKVP